MQEDYPAGYLWYIPKQESIHSAGNFKLPGRVVKNIWPGCSFIILVTCI